MITRVFFSTLGLLACAAARAHDPSGPQTIEHHIADRVSPNIYVVHSPRGLPNKANLGFINNPAFIVARDGVIVVDPGGSLQVGAELVKKIRKVTDKPVIAILNTHIHGDHWRRHPGVVLADPLDAAMVRRHVVGDEEQVHVGRLTSIDRAVEQRAAPGTRTIACSRRS